MTRPRSFGRLRRFLPKRERPTQRVALVLGLLALAVGTALAILDNNADIRIASVIIVVVVASSLVLSMNGMLILMAAVAVCLSVVFALEGVGPRQLTVSGFVMVVLVGTVGVVQAHRRDTLGLREVSAETVIGLIRERLLVQSQLPSVPAGWTVEIQQRPADGAAISGDFVSNRLISDGASQILHLAVIDVSGSGITAGPRALLLSGAVGGLLGSVPPDAFLAAANDYLARQQWSLGFASAIYVRLDLSTGEYAVRVAGHPPAVHFRPDSTPAWRTSPATGTVLGVLTTLSGQVDHGVLEPGEALFLYTDGVVEDRTRGIDAGTQRLKQNVELLAARDNWLGGARYLMERVPTQLVDDRTIVMIRRNPASEPLPAASTDRATEAPRAATVPDTTVGLAREVSTSG